MKTPVLLELFKQAAAGSFLMSDSILIKNSFSSIVDGSEYEDHGFMYSRSFQDPDGHIWEVLWMDMSAAPTNK